MRRACVVIVPEAEDVRTGYRARDCRDSAGGGGGVQALGRAVWSDCALLSTGPLDTLAMKISAAVNRWRNAGRTPPRLQPITTNIPDATTPVLA